jgi:hypothetical protein
VLFAVDGGTAAVLWNNGLVKTTNPEGFNWGWLCAMAWNFLAYVALFGFVAQFIYRWLTLNRLAFKKL